MQVTAYYAGLALTINLLLGVLVFAVNPLRPTNRSFLLVALSLCLWLGGVIAAYTLRSPRAIANAIRVVSLAAAFWPTVFYLLRISIIYHRQRWRDHLHRAWVWIALGATFGLICFSPEFIRTVQMIVQPAGGATPEPVYGLFGPIYFLYVGAGLCIVVGLLFYDQFNRSIVGVQRTELQFLLSAFVVVVCSILLNQLLATLTHSERLSQLAPLRLVVFSLIIAYGITSRGILNVRSAVRLMLSYLLLGVYTSVICAALWFALREAFAGLGIDSEFALALCSGVGAAMLINSTGTPLRRVTKKILPSADVDFETTVASVAHIVQTVTIFSELLERFSTVLRKAVGTPAVDVFLLEANGFHAHGNAEDSSIPVPRDDVLFSLVCAGGGRDLASTDLHRLAPGPKRDALIARMEALGADLIVPIRYHEELSGLLVLAPRLGGRVYGSTGRATLRLITEQLGVAIANARLYTEARQSQAYNQFLVEHLPCGVIATDPVGKLTVVNPEARRVLHLDESLPSSEVELPGDMMDLIAPTLESDTTAHDEELILRGGARDEAHLRVSCLPFASETQQRLGAVLVINDFTTLERLQRQVRQADRLASIGTLASGMAHEIKNPLTALKTFTQLLPKRYNDAEFRDDFSGLAGSEIARIERIVNQLLAFARPAPLMIEQVAFHEIIDGAVRLVGPQASRLNVEVRRSLHAKDDCTAADKDRLQQVLLNLLLNALQATPTGGWVELTTEREPGDADHDAFIRLDVRDSGCGIAPEMLPHIFDPFYTTKSEGTGLGLSVSYNIIIEHKGRLEVRSEIGKGTCFSVYLPAC